MAGDVRPGWVLAATWVTGEFEGNFSTMMTSCCIWSVNIMGVCRRRYCSNPTGRKKTQHGAERWGTSREMKPQTEHGGWC